MFSDNYHLVKVICKSLRTGTDNLDQINLIRVSIVTAEYSLSVLVSNLYLFQELEGGGGSCVV